MYETWKREFPYFKGEFARGVASNTVRGTQSIVGSQVTISSRDKNWPTVRRTMRRGGQAARVLKKLDFGHGFTTTKQSYDDESKVVNWSNGRTGAGYRSFSGTVFAYRQVASPSVGWPALTAKDLATMRGAGTIAIARCQPSNPAADLTVAIAELLRDRPAVPGASVFRNGINPKSVSGEYLNYIFGISPTIRDVKSFFKAMEDSEKILKQYHRDAGKDVRRGYSFPLVETKTVEETTGKVSPVPLVGVEPWDSTCALTITTTVREELWFKGSFTYHIPGVEEALGGARKAMQEWNILYGIKFTPDVAYALTPYSWLADWFGNMGSVLKNASNFTLSNQVMRYGYIMCRQKTTVEYHLHSAGLPFINQDLKQTFTTEIKQRLKASPYGFGINPSSFTDQQWAILAALGISRGPKFLGDD